MLQDVSVRSWMIESGRALIECILCAAERNIAEFRSAFSRMIDFVNEPNNWPKIEEELKTRGVSSKRRGCTVFFKAVVLPNHFNVNQVWTKLSFVYFGIFRTLSLKTVFNMH